MLLLGTYKGYYAEKMGYPDAAPETKKPAWKAGLKGARKSPQGELLQFYMPARAS